MTQWDGLLTKERSRVLVIGTTNRPEVLDPAIRRRLGRHFLVGLPTHEQRVGVLALLLRGEPLADDVDLAGLASLTDGYSGSDLKEVCRAAAMMPVREHLASNPAAYVRSAVTAAAASHPASRQGNGAGGPERPRDMRAIRQSDFCAALALVPPTQAPQAARVAVPEMVFFHDAHDRLLVTS